MNKNIYIKSIFKKLHNILFQTVSYFLHDFVFVRLFFSSLLDAFSVGLIVVTVCARVRAPIFMRTLILICINLLF